MSDAQQTLLSPSVHDSQPTTPTSQSHPVFPSMTAEMNTSPAGATRPPPSPTPSEQSVFNHLAEEIRERKLSRKIKYEGSVRSCEKVVPSGSGTPKEGAVAEEQ